MSYTQEQIISVPTYAQALSFENALNILTKYVKNNNDELHHDIWNAIRIVKAYIQYQDNMIIAINYDYWESPVFYDTNDAEMYFRDDVI